MSTKHGLLAGAAAGVLITPAAGWAQQVENALPEIVVTAQKRADNVNNVGMSISALSGDALQNAGVASTEDLVKVVPGFNYTPSSYGVPVYTIRGVGFYDTSLASPPTVSVYVDEAPLPYSILTLGAAIDLERVEVLKGPQGTLFGQNSTGGAINYIAAKPTEAFAAGGEVSYGRFNTIDVNGYVSGPVSETVRARAAVKLLKGDDWQRSYTRADSLGSSEVLIGRLLLDWTPTEALTIRANLNAWRDRSDNQAGQFRAITNLPARLPPALVAYRISPEDARAADWDPNIGIERDNDFAHASVRADYDLGWGTVTSITSYQELNRKSVSDADGTALEVFKMNTPGSIEVFYQELRLAGDTDRLRWIVGGNYQSETIEDSLYASYSRSGFPFPGAVGLVHQEVSTVAAFGNLDFQLTDALTLQGGIRYTEQERDFAGCLYDDGTGGLANFVAATGTARSGRTVIIPRNGCSTLGTDFLPAIVRSSLDEKNTSWRLGANWKVGPQALLYANVSRGYKSGAFPTAGATYSLQLAAATQESVLAYEAGAKLTLMDRTLQLNGAVFHYNYEDKQFRGKRIDLVLGPLNALLNIPESSVRGAEVQAIWQPINALTINFGATYVDSKIEGVFNNFNALGLADNLGGEAFPLTPQWQLTGDAEYRFDLTDNFGGFVGGSFTHQSETNSGLGETPLLDIKAYTLVDLRAGVRSTNGKWHASVWARNVGDVYYWTYVSTTSPDVAYRLAGRPRTVGVTVGMQY